MRRFMLVAAAVVLAAPMVAAQESLRLENRFVPGGWVAPGELVSAQEMRVLSWAARDRSPGHVVTSHNWDNASNVLAEDGQCATTIVSGDNVLVLGDFGFSIPAGASITGIAVQVLGSRDPEHDARVEARLRTGTTFSPWSGGTGLPGGVCGAEPESTDLGGDLWGRSWTPSEINATSFQVLIRAHLAGGGRPHQLGTCRRSLRAPDNA